MNQNPGINNGQPAYNDTPQPLYINLVIDCHNTVNTSLNPEFISSTDFDIDGARTVACDKVFANFGYMWKDHKIGNHSGTRR
jgi:hypothetical protein